LRIRSASCKCLQILSDMPRKKNAKRISDQKSRMRRQRQMTIRFNLLHERTPLVWIGAIFFLHLLGLILLFVPVQGLIDPQPILDQDWGLHFHHLKSLEAFWQRDKLFWGYNPLFMAGYPSNTIQDLSIKFFEVAALALALIGLSPIQWFKILAFLAMACVPWLMYFAARNLLYDYENKHVAAASAAILGTVYWWNSLPREMFFYGMIGYVSAAYLSVLGVSLFYRMSKEESSIWTPVHFAWLLFALAILSLHVQAILIILPPMLVLLVARPGLVKPRLLLWTVGPALFSLLANFFWLAPATTHRADDIATAIVAELPLFTSANPFTALLDYLGPGGYWTFRPSFWEKGFRLILLILGSLATWRLLHNEHKTLGVLITGALTSLFILSYFGSLIPMLRGWQPLRFKVPFDLFLVLSASYLVAIWLTARASASSLRLVPALLLCGAATFLVNLLQTESRGSMTLRTEFRPELSAIVAWIKAETPAAGRVLFEESGDETGFVYDGMYLSSFIPHWTGRQLIGGPINLYNDRHHFAEFHSGKLFKRDIQTLSDADIKNYFRLYNIGAVVAFHPISIQRLQSIPGLVDVDRRIGPIHLMKVNQPLTWFIEGSGTLKPGLNRLDLSDVQGKELVLKYHWVPGLLGTPDVKVVPVRMYDDPIPFIRILDPPPAFTLQIGKPPDVN
jgi:hypothetical protein